MAVYDPALLDALEAAPTIEKFHGRVWRHMFNDYAPDRINTAGARWNPPGVGAIYTASDRVGALAEGQHAVDLQPRRVFARRVLYELDVIVENIVDLNEPRVLESVGLTPANVTADDFTACQAVAGAAAWLGRGGLIVPSARSSATNLVIMVDHGMVDDIVIVSSEVVEQG